MAIDSIGALLSLAAPTAAQSTSQTQTKAPDPAEAAKAKADEAKARQAQELADVRKKGIYAWAQEKKLEALREKFEKEIKAAKGMDDKSLAAMSPEDRASAVSSLEAEIATRMKQAMEENLTSEAKRAANEGKPAQPMIIDISV